LPLAHYRLSMRIARPRIATQPLPPTLLAAAPLGKRGRETARRGIAARARRERCTGEAPIRRARLAARQTDEGCPVVCYTGWQSPERARAAGVRRTARPAEHIPGLSGDGLVFSLCRENATLSRIPVRPGLPPTGGRVPGRFVASREAGELARPAGRVSTQRGSSDLRCMRQMANWRQPRLRRRQRRRGVRRGQPCWWWTMSRTFATRCG